MYCRNCGVQMNDNQAICIKCGVKTGEGSNYCANCGAPMNPAATVCMTCGVAVKKAGLGKYDKLTMALIAFFIGGLGVHNFMMGETKKGALKIILMVLTCGVGSSLLALIDFIRILTDSYTVDPEKFI